MPDLNELENKKDEIQNELKEINELQRKHKYIYSAGYSPKCSVCNHNKIFEIEEMREKNYTLEEIKEALGLEVSVMALSRHFKNHTPKRTAYKLKQELLMMDKVINIIKKYPFLETYFKTRNLIEIEEFIKVNGFCTDCFKLCDNIKASHVGNSRDVIDYCNEQITNELNNISFGLSSWEIKRIFNQIIIKDNCTYCKDKALNDRLNILENVISKSILDLDVSPKELIYLLNTKYDNNINLMLEALGVRPPEPKDNTNQDGQTD